MIFVSGTSSVIGHETRHVEDVEAQVAETVRNLERIIRTAAERAGKRASLEDLRFVKTYIRRAADYETVRSLVESALPARSLYLESDICRRELLVEIEGIAEIGPRS
jgi:chorismate lyase / 3-hydroxybenzoate synthase